MKYAQAKLIADRILAELAPHCERIEIAGSIRRKKEQCGDIEIVCIPKKGTQRNKKTGQFAPTMGFIQTVNQWLKVRGEATDKSTQRMIIDPLDDMNNIALDLFTACVDNWGYIYAIRTGSADYSHKRLAVGWVKAGYHGKEGFLMDKNEKVVPVHEEKDLFKLIGLEYVEPQFRTI